MDVEGLARMIQEGAGRGGDMGGVRRARKFPDNLAVFLEIPGEGQGFWGCCCGTSGEGGGCSHEVIRRERRERCRELRRRGRSGPERSGEAEREDGGIVARSTGRGF